MRHPTRLLAVLASAATLVAGLLASPAAADGGHHHGHHDEGVVVVDTQFADEPSPVVKGTGPFRSCTEMSNVVGDAFDVGSMTIFWGVKELTCAKGDVILSYSAMLLPEDRTRGFWTVLASSLRGVHPGEGGPLFGDSDRCEDLTGNGCIRDYFVLR